MPHSNTPDNEITWISLQKAARILESHRNTLYLWYCEGILRRKTEGSYTFYCLQDVNKQFERLNNRHEMLTKEDVLEVLNVNYGTLINWTRFRKYGLKSQVIYGRSYWDRKVVIKAKKMRDKMKTLVGTGYIARHYGIDSRTYKKWKDGSNPDIKPVMISNDTCYYDPEDLDRYISKRRNRKKENTESSIET